jgi:hypothetical protein
VCDLMITLCRQAHTRPLSLSSYGRCHTGAFDSSDEDVPKIPSIGDADSPAADVGLIVRGCGGRMGDRSRTCTSRLSAAELVTSSPSIVGPFLRKEVGAGVGQGASGGRGIDRLSSRLTAGGLHYAGSPPDGDAAAAAAGSVGSNGGDGLTVGRLVERDKERSIYRRVNTSHPDGTVNIGESVGGGREAPAHGSSTTAGKLTLTEAAKSMKASAKMYTRQTGLVSATHGTQSTAGLMLGGDETARLPSAPHTPYVFCSTMSEGYMHEVLRRWGGVLM